MASILDRYGIKEVADVCFYDLETGAPVLYLDSLKVSTLEQTAETTYAQGGKGNARLIGWDFGKEITLTLEDALFSPKSMAIMFGNGEVAEADSITRTIVFEYVVKEGEETGFKPTLPEHFGLEKEAKISEVKYFDEKGVDVENDSSFKDKTKYFATCKVTVSGRKITISPDSFPGTYKIVGDTYARSELTGKDEGFQFIVYKGKITSENTITMEAEGDPSVFNMNVDVLRATDENGENVMIDLIQYDM